MEIIYIQKKRGVLKMKRKPYEEEDFIRIRNFLQQTSKDAPENKNWLIDRWIFGRYFHQVMHSSFDSWPQSVGR